ncbi:MAG: two-component system nitrate/nitrite response regulator NarL [Methylophagaceae bacterium]|jgi:two-component system nitrate/nitrite response regulator NarL
MLRDNATISPELLKTKVCIAIFDKDDCNAVAINLPDNYGVTQCHSLADLLTAVVNMQPDIILCHDDIVKEQQISLIASIKETCPHTRILVLGVGRTIESQIDLLKQGARGYFDNHLPPEKLHFAIHAILHGEVWVERYVISSLIDELTHVSIPEISQEQQRALASLSPKEIEVATLVSHGSTNKMIAHKMAITERTVKAHLTTIFQKLTLFDRLSLAILFRDLR